MWAREQTGLTLALFPFTAGVAGAQAGCWLVVIPSGALAALILAVTFAPRTPGLHRLPKVGAKRAEVTLRLIDRKDLTLESPGDAILQIGISHNGHQDIRARTNLLVPETVDLFPSDRHGNREGRGTEMEPTDESTDNGTPRSRYWVERGVELAGAGDSTLRHYRLCFPAAGTFGITLRLNAAEFYAEHKLERKITVREAQPGR